MKLHFSPIEILKTLCLCVMLALTPLTLAADDPVQPQTAQEQIDINSADAATLAQAMDGVGEVKAREIVAYREQHGKFQSLEQLLEVNGIGMATLERNRHRLIVVNE